MRLDMQQLAAFAAVVEEGSFEAAAHRLHITPSAVSQRIKALEQRTGQILVRRTRPCRATEAGEALVRLAGQIALLEHEAIAGSGSPIAVEQAPVRLPIAVNADSLATWFLPALADLAATHPVQFDVRQEDQDHSAALLKDGSVMAAVTAEPRPIQGCRSEKLGSMRYLAVAAPDYRRRYFPDGVTADTLAAAPVLIFNKKDALQERFLRTITRRRLEPPAHFVPSSWAFVDATRLGLAWGMVPEQMAKSHLDAGNLMELVPGRHLDVPLYWQRWRLDSPLLNALTESVKKAAAASLR